MKRIIDSPIQGLGLIESQTDKYDWCGCYPAFDEQGVCIAVIRANGELNDPDDDGTPPEILAGDSGDVKFDARRDGYYPRLAGQQ